MSTAPALPAQIAERIEELRKARGIKQSYVLASVPMSRETFSRIRKGDRDFRTIEILSMAGALRLPVVEVIRPFIDEGDAA